MPMKTPTRGYPTPHKRGEILKDVLFTADHVTWLKFNELARKRKTSRSALIRRYIQWEVKRARIRGEIA